MSDEISPTAAPRTGASDLIATLSHRAPRLALGIAASQLAWPLAKQLRDRLTERTRYTIKVLGTDDIYNELHEWVLAQLPSTRQQALVAWTSANSNMISSSFSEPPSSLSGKAGAPVRLRYDGARQQTVSVAGHKIKVMVTDPEVGNASNHDRWKPPELVFTAPSLAAQRALLAEIQQVADARAARPPVFRMLSRYGDWERLDDLPQRTLESVVLPDGQLDRLIADVGRFLDSEADYLRRCVPWHRGHLYEGPPGTGKTSVARAVASHFGMDIWYLPLADIAKDADLLRVMNRITPRSMLLLEDADVFHAATARDDGPPGATLSGLLNGLDGIATPHGLLTVLTTNSPGALDSALIRAGRIDVTEHFGLADAKQVSRLLSRWYGRHIGAGVCGLSPAAVIEVCKRHDSPRDAVAALLRLADTHDREEKVS